LYVGSIPARASKLKSGHAVLSLSSRGRNLIAHAEEKMITTEEAAEILASIACIARTPGLTIARRGVDLLNSKAKLDGIAVLFWARPGPDDRGVQRVGRGNALPGHDPVAPARPRASGRTYAAGAFNWHTDGRRFIASSSSCPTNCASSASAIPLSRTCRATGSACASPAGMRTGPADTQHERRILKHLEARQLPVPTRNIGHLFPRS
jgi:hypothetical protein